MNSLVADGLSELKSKFTDFFLPESNLRAERIWKLRKRNPLQFKNFLWKQYSTIMEKEGVEAAYRWSSFLFSGWKEKKLRSYSRNIWKSELKKKDNLSVKPFKEMIDLIRFMKERDWKVFIVTASPQIIIQEVCSTFFILEENVIGMKLVEKEEISTPEIIEPYTYGEGKVKAFLNQTGNMPDLSFGDSENDFPLLKAASRFGVLVDRGNEALAEKCKNINCLIQPVFN